MGLLDFLLGMNFINHSDDNNSNKTKEELEDDLLDDLAFLDMMDESK